MLETCINGLGLGNSTYTQNKKLDELVKFSHIRAKS